MPYKPKHPCSYPACPELTHEQYCERHAKQEDRRYDRQRGTAHQRGYTSRWNRIRKLVLAEEPLCRRCKKEGRATVATVVHHIKPKELGGGDEPENLEPLCRKHHEEEHKAERWKGG